MVDMPKPGTRSSVLRSIRGPTGVTPVGCGYYPKNQESLNLHCFDDRLSVVYLLQGRGTYRDTENGDLPLEPGALIFRYPARTHQTIPADPDWQEFYLDLPLAVCELLEACGYAIGTAPVRYPGVKDALLLECSEIHRHLQAVEDAGLPRVILRMQAFVLDALQAAGRDTGHHALIADVCEAIRAGEYWNTPLGDIARAHGLDPDSFRRLFRTVTGEPPIAYRNRVRLDTARMLLASTTGIGEIGEHLGFSSLYSFSRAFKNETGLSPRAYRRAYCS